MINRSWGSQLWDQFENLMKHGEKTVQFYEKYESFLRDRCLIEDEYARALKKLTKTYTPKAKEQEEFYNKFTFTKTFSTTLTELNDLASQHELIGENIRERSIKQLQSMIKECREKRKKYFDEYQKCKRQLDKQQDLMTKSLRKYEESFDSSRRARENFERANEDLQLSRAQVEKVRETMNLKAKLSDESHTAYENQVGSYNASQRCFYQQQLPMILTDLQNFHNKHAEEIKQTYRDFIQAHAEVLPRIQCCLNEISKQTENINGDTDAATVVDEYKSGYGIPEDLRAIDLNDPEQVVPSHEDQEQHQIYDDVLRSNTVRAVSSERNSNTSSTGVYAIGNIHVHLNGTQSLMSVPDLAQRKRSGKSSTIRKIFGSSNQRKSLLNSGSINPNVPHSNLPPAQRIKKFQEHIQNCKNELDKKQKSKEGLIKMKLVFQETPKFGDEHNVTQQIHTLDEQIQKFHDEIKRYESYIAEVERAQNPTENEYASRFSTSYSSDQSLSQDHYESNSHKRSSPETLSTTHSTSNDYQRLPSVKSMTIETASNIEPQQDLNGSFEEEETEQKSSTHAFALYDFTGLGVDGCQYINATTMIAGECVKIVENDQGDGWTRIEKRDGSSGFVPSSYLRLDASPVSHLLESNRF